MTASASGRDAKVIKICRKPARGPVTRIAFRLGWRMVRRFADALYVVMAGRAAAKNGIVVHFDQREPFGRVMAIVAEGRAQYVIDGFGRRRRYSPSDDMAADALSRRALKHGADVAGFAIGVQMCAIQSESGGQVIETRVESRLGLQRSREADGEQPDTDSKATTHCGVLISANELV